MNKLFVILVVTVAFFTITTQMTHATTITFNEPGLAAGFGPAPFFSGTPKGTMITDQFAALGVRFSIANGVDYVSSPAFINGLAGPSGGNVLAVNTVPSVTGAPATLTATFIDPAGSGSPATVAASSFSVFVTDTEASPSPRVIIRTFDLSGNLLEEQGLTTLGSTLNFSEGQIARVEFFDNGDDGHGLDDFSFGPVSAVPEPATFVLLSSGLLGLGGWRRFRKN